MVKFILSVSTIPTRIDYLIKIIPLMKIRYNYFVINICCNYKRFGKFKISRDLLNLCKNNNRIVFQFIDDAGPLNKYIGGFNFMKKKKLYDNYLIIVDDDTVYNRELFYHLIDDKSTNNITTGSGFNYDKNRNYDIVVGCSEMVEGYAGVCFEYNQLDEFIMYYSKYYKCKWAIPNGRNLIQPQEYGFNNDALHRNGIFGSNMGSYNFLNENITILETFKKKFNLNNEIRNLRR